ncbi:High affinity cAMP-specific and IBMX-insensitive 3',5'-cyclic phosphodiesterase 9A, partial [Entomortierella beljakovae]
MLKFRSDKAKSTSLDFKIWDQSIPEIYGIVLSMFVNLDLVECLGITEGELLDFIIDVDRGYLATFYHSFYHAADVTAVLFHMLMEMNASQYLSKPDMAALLLAGLCHDIGHPGLNNLFQVNAKTDIVKQYGEVSVLEKYSCSLAMDLVAKHKLFRNISKSPSSILPEGNFATEESMKDSMVKAIMATDMSFHYDMLNNLNTLIEFISTPSSSPSVSDNEATETESEVDFGSSPPSPSQHGCTHNVTITDIPPSIRDKFECTIPRNHRRLSSTSSISSDSSQISINSEISSQTTRSLGLSRLPIELTPELRQSFANCLLHAADISNAVKPWDICKHWSDLVVQEFFRQGDIEKSMNLPVSPNMDRAQYNQPQISLGFGDFVVQPYFECFVEFLPEAAPFLANLASNRGQWVLQKAAKEAEKDTVSSVNTPIVVDTHKETKSTTSEPQPLISGRRVSVAAGVVVLDDTRSPRHAHHKRARHVTNSGSSPYLPIRKIKRSHSGRSLSTSIRDFYINNLHLATDKTIISPEDAIFATECESTHCNKDPNLEFAMPNLCNGIQEGSAHEQMLPPMPSLQQRSEKQGLSPQPPYYDHGAYLYRQKRHGSLQLENRHPSIRQEYGDGYVILNHPDSWLENTWGQTNQEIETKHIPVSLPQSLPMAGAWPSSALSLEKNNFFHNGHPLDECKPHERSTHNHPQGQVKLHQIGIRSSTPAIMSRCDWLQKKDSQGLGPLDSTVQNPTLVSTPMDSPLFPGNGLSKIGPSEWEPIDKVESKLSKKEEGIEC